MINQMSPEVQQVASGSSLARKLLAKAETIEILVSQPSYHILPLSLNSTPNIRQNNSLSLHRHQNNSARPFFWSKNQHTFAKIPELVQQNLEKTVSLGLNMFESASCKSWARKRSWKCCHAMGAPPSKPRPSPKSRW